jgi:hypothetical protein
MLSVGKSRAGAEARTRDGVSRRRLLFGVGAAVLGGVGVGVGVHSFFGTTSDAAELNEVSAADHQEALQTLSPQAQADQKASACNQPLAYVMVLGGAGSAGQYIQIRSGNYLSPRFKLLTVAQRIALPYPAPYPSGSGVLSLLGNTGELAVALYPTWHTPALTGERTINVFWTPRKLCES